MTTEETPQWIISQKLLALFVIAYAVLHIFPFPLDDLPLISDVLSYYDEAIDFCVLWVGKHILSIPSLLRIEMTGSGDTTFDYVATLTNVILAILIAFIAFLFTRRRSNYSTAYDWMIVYMRYYLALTMFGYGIVKLFGTQFPTPSFGRLEESIGDASPMGLLWTFMGYSKSYSVFTGLGEIIGGYLLLFRRTTALGCIITIFIMANVLMLNLSYDVPVKLHSAHLLLFALVILAPNLKNLYGLFILNKPAAINYPPLYFSKKWMRISRIVFKSLIVIGLPAVILMREIADPPNKNNHNLNGAYINTSYILNGDTLAPLTTDSIRWSKLMIQDQSARIATMTNKMTYYQSKIDTSQRTIRLTSLTDTSEQYIFSYQRPTDSLITISGVYQDDTIRASFTKKSLNDYRLMKRGFHWVNEYPYNK